MDVYFIDLFIIFSPYPSQIVAVVTRFPQVCQEVEVKKEDPEVRFSVGDLVWTKVAGYPWWPCMVTTDPMHDKHVKTKGAYIARTGQNRTAALLHCSISAWPEQKSSPSSPRAQPDGTAVYRRTF